MAATAGKQGGNELVIAANGQTAAVIVVSPKAGPNEKKAANDLAKYIGLMCGAKPAIANTAAAIKEAMAGQTPKLVVEDLEEEAAEAEDLEGVELAEGEEAPAEERGEAASDKPKEDE